MVAMTTLADPHSPYSVPHTPYPIPHILYPGTYTNAIIWAKYTTNVNNFVFRWALISNFTALFLYSVFIAMGDV